MDEVFKALADPNRRKILDIVRDNPGINVNELSEYFQSTRYGTMKHIKLLEEANLLVSSRQWKEKKLHINAIPIQMIYERWISKYSQDWAASLTNLKKQLEGDES